MTGTITPTSPLAPYVPRIVRGWSEEPEAPRARTIDGSVVSVDISGFTALAERLQAKGKEGAEELVTRISAVFDGLILAAERHGGDVLKFRGDALLLLFAGDRHAERACGGASDMQWMIEENGTQETTVGTVELRMSVGVHSAPVHLFLTEVPHRELLIAGPAATRVFELEDLASAGEIVLSRETAALVDPAWLADEKEGARLMARLEQGASPIPPPPDVAGLNLHEYVPRPLRDHLAVSSGEAEHRQVTVAFLKLSETDSVLESHGPEALLARIDSLAEATGRACETYGITWLESDIDVGAIKLYLTAGAPATSGDDEERMLRCLRDVLSTCEGLTLRAGINRGHVFTGDIGASTRRTYAVMGDTVNLAARLCGKAEPRELLATPAVLDRARTRFATTEKQFQVKGKTLPVVAHALGEALGLRENLLTDAVPLIGRERELTLLDEALADARAGRLSVVELVAEPGIGKSRLVQELQGRAAGMATFKVAAEQYTQAESYAMVRDLFRDLLAIPRDGTPEAAGRRLTAWVMEAMPELAPWLPLLAIPFAGSVEPTPESDALDPAASRERLFRTAELFLSHALDSPTLLVLEDVHWLDDASSALIGHVLEIAPERPWLVCATTRPTDATLVPIGRGARVALEPLNDGAVEALALAIAAEHGLSADAVTAVAQRAAGNPLFLRELAFAAQHGELESIPDTIESLLTMRFDALAPTDRVLLRFASVFGPSFEVDLVEEALGQDMKGAGDLETWARLGEFVVPMDDRTLAFRHDLVRATAYEGLSFRRRREIHGKVGGALVHRLGERADEEAALLSLHFHHAGEHGHAWHYSVIAGNRAAAGYANVVAAELYVRALRASEHLVDLPVVEISVVAESLGDVSELSASYDAGREAYTKAYDLAREDVISRIRLQRKLGILLERRGEYDDAKTWFDAALEGAEEADTRAEAQGDLAELELEYAVVLYRRGRYSECFEWSERAANRAERCGSLRALAHAYRVLDSADRAMGGFDGSWLERALAIYDQLGDRLGRAIVLNNMGIRAYYAGRWDEAQGCYAESREAEREVGDVVRAATASNNEAEILLDQGHVHRAVGLFEETLKVYRSSGYAFGAGVVVMNLARCAGAEGRFADAEQLFIEAEEELLQLGSDSFVLETRMRRAECLVLQGRHDEARQLALRTIEDSRAADELGPREASLRRTAGLALMQAGELDAGLSFLTDSLETARGHEAEFEVALTLHAIAGLRSADSAAAETERDRIFGRLGVVSVPAIPLAGQPDHRWYLPVPTID